MSDPSSLPPYLPDLIGDETVAETMLTHDGCQVVVTYRPAVLMRLALDGATNQVKAVVAELVVDGVSRYPESSLDERDGWLLSTVQAIMPTLNERCAQWATMYVMRHSTRVLEAKRRYEQGQG